MNRTSITHRTRYHVTTLVVIAITTLLMPVAAQAYALSHAAQDASGG